jgi:hypothetical protein
MKINDSNSWKSKLKAEAIIFVSSLLVSNLSILPTLLIKSNVSCLKRTLILEIITSNVVKYTFILISSFFVDIMYFISLQSILEDTHHFFISGMEMLCHPLRPS